LERAISRSESEATCIGCFSPDSSIFEGHFPGDPIVPGVLLIEGLAQTLAYWALAPTGGGHVVLTGADKARFRRPVRPGQWVRYSVVIDRTILGETHARGRATVDDETVATAVVKARFDTATP